MEQLIAGIPIWVIWGVMGAHIFALAMSILMWWRLEETPLETLGEGFLGWGGLHETTETIMTLPLLFVPLGIWGTQFGSTFFKGIMEVFIRGFCAIGPTLTLLGVEKLCAKKLESSFKEMAGPSLVVIGLIVLTVNLTFWTLPVPVLAALYYSPVIMSFIVSGFLLWKAGYSKKWIAAFGLQGGGHEAFEVVIFGLMGIMVLRGAIDPKIPGFMVVVFLVLQILGPLALYFVTKSE